MNGESLAAPAREFRDIPKQSKDWFEIATDGGFAWIAHVFIVISVTSLVLTILCTSLFSNNAEKVQVVNLSRTKHSQAVNMAERDTEQKPTFPGKIVSKEQAQGDVIARDLAKAHRIYEQLKAIEEAEQKSKKDEKPKEK